MVAGLYVGHWQTQRGVNQLRNAITAIPHHPTAPNNGQDASASLRQAEARYQEARAQLETASQKLAHAAAQLASIEGRVRQLESQAGPMRLGGRAPLPPPTLQIPPGTKRGWGPEQAAGEPDTIQAGDLTTAWAPRERDAGEEWLKLEYERAVDIAEVRVRQTYNPGAISKVTAVSGNGSEMTLWEGVEPPSQAPVEMSFQVTNRVVARTVKVYLDTARVPGWNEIDAVQVIGKDGSQQWAHEATASSTFAEGRIAFRTGERNF